jgi:LPXTG-motif cell wall-anchored protein
MNLFDHHCLRAGARKIAVSAVACLMAFSSSVQIFSQVYAEDTQVFTVAWDDSENNQKARPAATYFANELCLEYSVDTGSQWTVLNDDTKASLGYASVPTIPEPTGTDSSKWSYSFSDLKTTDTSNKNVIYRLYKENAPAKYSLSYDNNNQMINRITDFTDDESQLQLSIDDMEIVDKSGNKKKVSGTTLDLSSGTLAATDHISADMSFKVLKNYAERKIKEGDGFTITIPQQLKLENNSTPKEIKSGDTLIATYTVSDNKINVVFAAAVSDLSNIDIGGKLSCEFKYNADGLTNKTQNDVPWQLQDGGTAYHFKYPAKSTTLSGIAKFGTYDKDTRVATWTITVGSDASSKGLPLAGIMIKDTYLDSDLSNPTVTDKDGNQLETAALTGLDAGTSGFSYTFPSDSTAVAPYVLTVKTPVAAAALTNSAENDGVKVSNTASIAEKTDGEVHINDKQTTSASAGIPSVHLTKNGTQIDSSVMEWSLVANDTSLNLNNVVVTDELLNTDSAKMELDKTSIAINWNKLDASKVYSSMAAANEDHATAPYAVYDAENKLSIYFGNISSAQNISFDTTMEYKGTNKDKNVEGTNTASMTYEWPDEYGIVGKKTHNSPEFGYTFNVATIDKEVTQYNTKENPGIIDWHIKSSIRTDAIKEWFISDQIESNQSLVDGSIKVSYKGNELETNKYSYTYDAATDTMKFGFSSAYSPNDIEIVYQTKALSYYGSENGAYNYKNDTYHNKASIDVTSSQDTNTHFTNSSEDSCSFENDFLKKSGSYEVIDADKDGVHTSTGYLHYQIVLNASHMPVTNLTLTDSLATDMKIKAVGRKGTDKAGIETEIPYSKDNYAIADNTDDPNDQTNIKITQTPLDGSPSDVTDTYKDTVIKDFMSNGTLSLKQSAETRDSYTVDFYIQITNDELEKLQAVYPNGYEIVQSNSAHAGADEYNNGHSISATSETTTDNPTSSNQLISKSGAYNSSDSTIAYNVNINPNGMNMKGTIIKDTPDSCINIDLSSVELYYAKHNANGTISSELGDAVDTSKWTKKLAVNDQGKITLQVSIPNGKASYVLKYNAKVISAPADGETIKNNIGIYGSNYDSDSNSYTLSVDSSAWAWMKNAASLKLVKSDKTNSDKGLSGAVYELYDDADCTNKIGTGITNSQGFAFFYGLPYSASGTDYWYKEVTAPAGYELDTSKHEVSMTAKGVKTENVSDDMIQIQLRKVSKDTKDAIQGADFKITGKFVNGKTELTGTPVELSEQMKGNLYASDISADESTWSVYSVTEIKRPDGYLIEENPAEFVVDDASQIHVVTDESKCTSIADGVTLDFADDATKVSILKTDAKGKALKGAQFKIEGTFADGSKVQNFTSEAEASTFKALFIAGNTYAISEEKAPDGYVKMQDAVSFTVGEDGLLKLAEGTSSAVTLSEDQKEIRIADTALSIELNKVAKDTKKSIDGAIFKISGSFVDGRSEITGSTDAINTQLKANLYASDPAADKTAWNIYSIKEVSSPEGYSLEGKQVSFIVDDASQIHVVADESKCTSIADGVTLDFADDATKVSILKTDINGKALAGAQFKVEGTFADGSKVQNFTLETEASTFKALFIAGNTYAISEVKAPDGYIKMQDAVSFTVGEDGLLKLAEGTSSAVTLSEDQKEIRIADEASKISVLKTDVNGKALAGAQFKIEGTFADDSKVQNFTSEAEASTFKALFIAGNTYAISEVKAPDGYDAIKGSISVKIDEAGKIILNSSTKLAEVSEDGTVLKISNTETIAPVDTGDKTNTILYFGIMIGAAAIAIALIIFRRKKEKH